MTASEGQSRREFLKRSIFALGGLIALGLALPSSIYVLSPLWKRSDEEWVEIAEAAQIPKGEPTKVDYIRRKKDGWVTIEERASVWVVTADGVEFTVFDPRCTHLGCPYRFDEAKKQFLCPCHTAVFNVDGRVISGPPPRPLDRLPAKVVGGRLLIQARPIQVGA
jgi:menaquinol-cytochrome c reductase iron-sulfur subunit